MRSFCFCLSFCRTCSGVALTLSWLAAVLALISLVIGFRSKHGCFGSTSFCSTRSHSSTGVASGSGPGSESGTSRGQPSVTPSRMSSTVAPSAIQSATSRPPSSGIAPFHPGVPGNGRSQRQPGYAAATLRANFIPHLSWSGTATTRVGSKWPPSRSPLKPSQPPRVATASKPTPRKASAHGSPSEIKTKGAPSSRPCFA